MSQTQPSLLDTEFFAGMYDPETLIGWLARKHYTPFNSDFLFPLCVTDTNCEQVLKLIGKNLGIHFLRSLERFLQIATPDLLEANKDSPYARHYIRCGSLDQNYLDGVAHLREYINTNRFLETPLSTLQFRGMYDHRILIENLQKLDCTSIQSHGILPLCVTNSNVEHVRQAVRNQLGAEYWDLSVNWANSFMRPDLKYYVLHPASQHYNLDGEVDPKLLEGLDVLEGCVA